MDPPTGGFVGPVKRSVTIAGHQTSISLEPIFWERLEAEAVMRALPLNALIAAIDHARIQAEDPPNLASALRTWLVAQPVRDILRQS
ncbi:ribbon-helix-helix domain-containing protein [Sphingomonas sp. UNC305MFCol5.2]|uniref:ribbon-helix-helix domain-containing protein n=1 Tax=Sphingomonas sp. UNC305MFCol5.2 TaxID=1449076 RepID=UPI003FA795FB